MTNIKAKFKINPFTYFLILIALLSGFIKNILLILLIIIIHECGHILFIKHYGYSIESIEIFPFGGITKVEKPLNTPLKQELRIAFGGVFFQMFLFLIFFLLNQKGYIRANTYEIFQSYNKIIMFFNLLPMIPLDGSIIMHSLLEYFFPYQKAYQWYLIGASCMFLFFFFFHTMHNLNNYMIVTFLLFKLFDTIKKRKYIYERFYLERYLYEFPYTKIKSHPYPNLNKLKKGTLHFFWQKDRYLHEKEFLKNRYNNNHYQIDRPTKV